MLGFALGLIILASFFPGDAPVWVRPALIVIGGVLQSIAIVKWIAPLPFDPARCRWCSYQLDGLGDMPVRCPECGHGPRTGHPAAPLAEALVVWPAVLLGGLATVCVFILATVTLAQGLR